MSLKVAFLDNDQFTWISKEIEFIIIVYLFAVYKGRGGIPLYSKWWKIKTFRSTQVFGERKTGERKKKRLNSVKT